ncbi:T9SS type A sorting domain-containing protein [Candidatus Desantisbacteria bacterium]|nr:T9SS type A sorting domain-containing protein [Candidatus Desantisbacteria bacterium]
MLISTNHSRGTVTDEDADINQPFEVGTVTDEDVTVNQSFEEGTATDEDVTVNQPFEEGTVTDEDVTIDILTAPAAEISETIQFAGTVYNINILDEQGNKVEAESGQIGAITVCLLFPDNDQNGIVDGTDIREENLVIYQLNKDTWTALQTTVNGTENYACAYVPHISIVTVNRTATDNNNVKVYPNPYKKGDADNYIYFDQVSQGAVIKIYNIAGELVKEIDVVACPQIWNISQEDIASGIYIYTVTGGGGGKSTGRIGIVK